jgi:glutamate N-acetyltransferase / amino-acid N-acetyltransferase
MMTGLFSGLPEMKIIGGLQIATASAGIRKSGRRDLVLFELAENSTVAATFTRNLFCAAPVVLAKEHLKTDTPRYLLINTGNANAGTGTEGYNNAVTCCEVVAKTTACKVSEVLPFSTGVIGEQLPVERITNVVQELIHNLGPNEWSSAASAILTTDTVPKGASCTVTLSGGDVTITGISKGSGMIRPDMATMLAFVATDAVVCQSELQTTLRSSVDKSFNRITVDGDTSTNDACVLMATGSSGVNAVATSKDRQLFSEALNQIMVSLAKQIVMDGEGATKFVTIDVTGAGDEKEGEKIAFTVAHSPLVKTALFASDPNWGRILAAVGRAGITDLDLGGIDIFIGEVRIVHGGEPDPLYTENRGKQAMSGDEINIRIELGRGQDVVTVWTCDFSYDYVKINAEYRT